MNMTVMMYIFFFICMGYVSANDNYHVSRPLILFRSPWYRIDTTGWSRKIYPLFKLLPKNIGSTKMFEILHSHSQMSTTTSVVVKSVRFAPKLLL